MSRLEEAKKILEELHDRAPDLEELALARTNGLIIVSLRKSINQDKNQNGYSVQWHLHYLVYQNVQLENY